MSNAIMVSNANDLAEARNLKRSDTIILEFHQ